jgi:tripartite-type tricarboxylate transporter receptor subunit TctC
MLLTQCLATSLHAQCNFPAGTITIVFPTEAGDTSDSVARMLAKSMQDGLKQPVIVSNRPCATGLVGFEGYSEIQTQQSGGDRTTRAESTT